MQDRISVESGNTSKTSLPKWKESSTEKIVFSFSFQICPVYSKLIGERIVSYRKHNVTYCFFWKTQGINMCWMIFSWYFMISSILSTFSKGSRPDLRFFGQESFLPQFQKEFRDYAGQVQPRECRLSWQCWNEFSCQRILKHTRLPMTRIARHITPADAGTNSQEILQCHSPGDFFMSYRTNHNMRVVARIKSQIRSKKRKRVENRPAIR